MGGTAEKNHAGEQQSLKCPGSIPIMGERPRATLGLGTIAMNVSNLKPGGVDRKSEPTVEITRPRIAQPHAQAGVTDSAAISDSSRDLHAVHDFAQRVADVDADRQKIVDAARDKLRSGALDTPAAYRGAAAAILGRGDVQRGRS